MNTLVRKIIYTYILHLLCAILVKLILMGVLIYDISYVYNIKNISGGVGVIVKRAYSLQIVYLYFYIYR